MKKLDFDTFCALQDALDEHKYDWNHEQFRAYAQELGLERDIVIPCEYLDDMLEYRYVCYNLADYGMEGKFSEVRERVKQAIAREKDLRWNEFNAHRAGRRDLSYGRKAVEKKTGAGDWLVSTKNSNPEKIVAEYSKKHTMIHWEVEDLEINITCEWCQLMEYLGQYRSSKTGPERGAAYWFKSYTKPAVDGDRWILEIQTYRTSEKKLAWIKACPYNNLEE